MMKENILDVLVYLFENYMFEVHEPEHDRATLEVELSQAGFDRTVIDLAFDWLENLAVLCENNTAEQLDRGPAAIRHYSAAERAHIDTEARGLLLKLEQYGVLDKVSREMVIDRLMALGYKDIELEHVKWIILMVLSNFTEEGGINELTESLVLDEAHGCAH